MLLTVAEVNALSAAVTTRRRKLRRRATKWLVWGNDAIVQRTLREVEILDNLTAKLANVKGHAAVRVQTLQKRDPIPVEFDLSASV